MPRRNIATTFPLAAFGLALLAACSEPAPYDLRRETLDGRPGESLEAGGVARSGVKLKPGQVPSAVDLADLTAGRILLFAAPSGDAAYGGGLEIELRETGWRSWTGLALRERCVLRWGEPGTPVDAPWQPCSFELARAVPSARLEFTPRGPKDGEFLVSDIRVEGRAKRGLSNVFIVLVDAARFDGLRPFHPEASVGANLEQVASDSVVLRNLRSSSSWTRPAVATLFTGLRADRHRVLDRGDVMPEVALTLAEILRERGYSTAAWSTNPNVLPVWGLAQGFDAFVDQGSDSWLWGKTDGAAVVSRLRAALASRGGEPLFYYAHLMDPHAPYRPSVEQREAALALDDLKSAFPRPLAIMTVPNDWQAFVDYTGELLDTDDHLGELVRVLKEDGLYDDALLVVVADHGEEFLDHGGRDHGRTLYEEVLKVPALIKLPGNRLRGTVVEESLTMADLMPTLLGALGAEVPAGIDGVAIALGKESETPARPSVASLNLDNRRMSSIFDPPWKLIRNELTGGRELYNLTDDPRERKNLVLWHQDVVVRLSEALDLITSHGQEGWHLLLCGTLDEASIELSVRPSSGTVQLFGFQEEEAIAVGEPPGTWRLRPTLAPITVQRPVFGKITTVVVPEQVELLVPPGPGSEGSTLEIRSESGGPFDYRTGMTGESRSAQQIVLDSGSADVSVAQGARMECAPPAGKPGTTSAPAQRPFVRAWYVPPVRSVATENLDPVMRERLRALGYLQ